MEKPFGFQVTLDATNPHALADWWAELLGWAVEPGDEAFIRRMIAEGYANESETMTYRGALVWAVGAAIIRPDGQRFLFQRVPEAKTVKNRMHLDVRVGAERADEQVAAAVARGATVLHTGRQGPHGWTTLADPEGNEFCIS
jgi:hypothetical protein